MGLCGANKLKHKFGTTKKSSKWFKKRVVQIGGSRSQDSGKLDPETQVEFVDNTINSSKYTIFTFWFLNLFEQFRRVANFYFLIVAVVQLCLPSPPVSPFTSVFPLVFVVVVTMIKQGYEDVMRHRADREINFSSVTILQNSKYKIINSKDIKVGDIVHVKINDTFPADLVLLCTPSVSGKAHVMTANLDGETNLKSVFASKLTKNYQKNELCELSGQIECESPNPDLTTFKGKMILQEATTSLSLENLVMRGTKLSNTEYVYGCCVYSGKDTKMSKNSKTTANKFSTVEKTMNKFLLFFLALLLAEVVFSTMMKYIVAIDFVGVDERGKLKHWYMDEKLDLTALQVIEDFFSYLVIYNYIIPISLYVTLEFQKFVGSKFLCWDVDLFDPDTKEGPKCNSSDLNEELGQIQVLFSDKTGTLTENIMVFQEASIKGRKYKYDDLMISSSTDDQNSMLTTNTEDSLFDSNGSYRDPMDEIDVIEFLRALALCHSVQIGNTDQSNIRSTSTPDRTRKRLRNRLFSQAKGDRKKTVVADIGGKVMVAFDDNSDTRQGGGVDNAGFENDENNEIVFNASSPDEKALVEACVKFGVRFAGEVETENNNILQLSETRSGSEVMREYEKLNILEFDSTRKRMSIILKNRDNNKVIMYTKGAESSIIPRCIEGPFVETSSHIDEYALVGLRTLAIASRELSQRQYESFVQKLNTASQSLEERERKTRDVFDEIESNMTLIGATAVEDKLQEGVRDTLVKMNEAGISVWILTGDKKETAVNISYSCGHLQPHHKLLDLTAQNHGTIERKLVELEKEISKVEEGVTGKQFALLVDGPSLIYIMPDEEYKQQFYKVAIKCTSVICCRMSPLQKSEVVSMIKNSKNAPITAAIGDGGNDVAMIQEAHVGLGIMGKEGRAAVRAADFAFPKFKHLKKVVLVHGHWYYYRVAILVQYFFYKNVACFSCQLYYAIFNSFSTQTLFDSISLSLYNICYTSLPIFLFSLMEQNLDKNKLLETPSFYKRHFRNKLLRWREFFLWFFQALWHSLVFFFGWLLFWSEFGYGGHNITRDLVLSQTSFGTSIYASIVTLVNIRLLFQSRSWNIYLILSIVASILFYVLFNLAENSISVPVSWNSFLSGSKLNVSSEVTHMPLDFDSYWVYHHVLSSLSVWMFTVLLLVVAIAPDVVIRILRKHWAAIKAGSKKKNKRSADKEAGEINLDFVNKGYKKENIYIDADNDNNTYTHSSIYNTKL